MIIALASPRIAPSIDAGLEKVRALASEAASHGAAIVCFPEAYIPGLRGLDFDVPSFDDTDQERVLATTRAIARTSRIALILGMELLREGKRHIAAAVISAHGQILGFQTKNQLDPTEEPQYAPGEGRQIFDVDGVKFGIAICHEGFRYPETVRWAAMRGAKVVFHQHFTGSDQSGVQLKEWGSSAAPYYEKAMMMRSIENTVYFASVGCATKFQESATSIIGPSGECVSHLPYGREGVLVQKLDLELATGRLASRYAPERYVETGPGFVTQGSQKE